MLRRRHWCESLQPYVIVVVPSQSNPRLSYEVQIPHPDDPPEEYVCVCRGFEFRGKCAHQELAALLRCGWNELEGPEEQTSEQQDHCVCPRCNGKTWTTTELTNAKTENP